MCPRAFEYGYPEPYCQAMVDREMRFYLGEWIPLYDVNDKESEELKAKLLEKDIKLNEQGKWILTGGTLDEVMNKIYLSKINLAMYVLAMTSLKEVMEYGIPFSIIITFATSCDANDAL